MTDAEAKQRWQEFLNNPDDFEVDPEKDKAGGPIIWCPAEHSKTLRRMREENYTMQEQSRGKKDHTEEDLEELRADMRDRAGFSSVASRDWENFGGGRSACGRSFIVNRSGVTSSGTRTRQTAGNPRGLGDLLDDLEADEPVEEGLCEASPSKQDVAASPASKTRPADVQESPPPSAKKKRGKAFNAPVWQAYNLNGWITTMRATKKRIKDFLEESETIINMFEEARRKAQAEIDTTQPELLTQREVQSLEPMYEEASFLRSVLSHWADEGRYAAFCTQKAVDWDNDARCSEAPLWHLFEHSIGMDSKAKELLESATDEVEGKDALSHIKEMNKAAMNVKSSGTTIIGKIKIAIASFVKSHTVASSTSSKTAGAAAKAEAKQKSAATATATQSKPFTSTGSLADLLTAEVTFLRNKSTPIQVQVESTQ